MKRKYEKPVFYAETYAPNMSIAKCAYVVDGTPVEISAGENVCGGGLDGHVYGGQNGKKGALYAYFNGSLPTIYLFNDGNASGCTIDWDRNTNFVSQTGTTFAESFYGNDANAGVHAPGDNGAAFYS